SGWVAMPEDDIEMDLLYKSDQTSFKTLLSLIPAIYMTDYKDLKATGDFNLSGSAKGIYSDADSTMPDISLNLKVNNGLISYPALPEQIKNINLKSDIFIDGRDMDKTVVNVEEFHMELAGNPFDMTLVLKTPMSDPDIKCSMLGKIDLTALSKAIPMDSIGLSGVIDMSVEMAGRLSTIEKAQYESFKASGTMNIKDMLIAMTGYPEVKINEAGFEFTPAYANMKTADLVIGKNSDFVLTGKLENYIPYVLKNDVIRGNLSLRSKLVNLTDIMDKLLIGTSETDTSALAVIKVPENIDFDFNAMVDRFTYNKIEARNVKGHIIIKDGILRIRETGMNILGGAITMNADYDTRDTLKPVVKADLTMEKMGVKDAFNTFNTVQKLAPAAKGIDGKIGVRLTYSSLLGRDLMPVIQTISGGGRLQSDEVTLVESASYNKMKELLKLGDNYTNTFKDLNVSFKINEGRIFVSPFNVKAGNIKMNIAGDQGIDQTLNYIIKTELPRSDLGTSVNSLIDNMSAQAAAFGFAFKPADIIKVNVKVTGTFGKPVIIPFFGSTADESKGGVKEEVKEVVKQAIEATVDQAKEKVRSEAEIRGDKLVQEAEEKGQQLRDEAAKAAEKIRLEADSQAQKLLKEAENKGAVAKLAAQKGADSLKKEADKKANQLTQEADNKANKLVEEAKSKREELLNKL
ncbi:MAG TPA: AsmA-like C-terminal region-containing protein, partial [Bacteroidales bacterium]|nr:AsmA-like C-terminal region-containing protein [Bacteroidales bacterium]